MNTNYTWTSVRELHLNLHLNHVNILLCSRHAIASQSWPLVSCYTAMASFNYMYFIWCFQAAAPPAAKEALQNAVWCVWGWRGLTWRFCLYKHSVLLSLVTASQASLFCIFRAFTWFSNYILLLIIFDLAADSCFAVCHMIVCDSFTNSCGPVGTLCFAFVNATHAINPCIAG